MSYWIVSTLVLTLLAIIGNAVFTVWVTIGGWFDLVKLLRDLKEEHIDATDDGRVPRGLHE